MSDKDFVTFTIKSNGLMCERFVESACDPYLVECRRNGISSMLKECALYECHKCIF